MSPYLHLSRQKSSLKCQKWSNLASFGKPKACSQTVLPESSILIGNKLAKKAKNKKSIKKADNSMKVRLIFFKVKFFRFWYIYGTFLCGIKRPVLGLHLAILALFDRPIIFLIGSLSFL